MAALLWYYVDQYRGALVSDAHLWRGEYQAESFSHAAEQFFDDPDLLLPETKKVVIHLCRGC